MIEIVVVAHNRQKPEYWRDRTVPNSPRVFERVTWHSAQHCRQLVPVLERMGIQPDRLLTASDLAGLPLPERLWE